MLVITSPGNKCRFSCPILGVTKSVPTNQAIDTDAVIKARYAHLKQALIYRRNQNKPDADQAWAALQKIALK